MPCLQTLRRTRWLTRLVLVWFALFVGAAIASPMVKPVAGQMVCTSMGGMKMVVDDEAGRAAAPTASVDCPLCAPTPLPPPPPAHVANPPRGLPHALQSLPAARIAGLTGAPLPPRGPPVPL